MCCGELLATTKAAEERKLCIEGVQWVNRTRTWFEKNRVRDAATAMVTSCEIVVDHLHKKMLHCSLVHLLCSWKVSVYLFGRD
jgi:hypothetical protein